MEDEKQNESLISKGVINQLKADNDSKLREEIAGADIKGLRVLCAYHLEDTCPDYGAEPCVAQISQANTIHEIYKKHGYQKLSDMGITAELERIVKHRNGDYTYYFRMVEDED